ncbi:4719_t:CDS:2, partial [Funneliformis geosporum]
MLKNEIYTICIIRQLHTNFKPGFSYEVDEMCKFSGPLVIEFDNSNIIKELLHDVVFQPFTFIIDKLTVFVPKMGTEWNNEWNRVSKEFISTFSSKFRSNEYIARYEGSKLTEVWKKVGVMKKIDGK